MADTKLPAAHRSLLEALRKRPLRIDELAPVCGLAYEDLTRALYALSLIELVVPAARLPRQPVSPAAAPKRKGPVAEPATARAANTAVVSDSIRKELMELVLNHRRRDPFDLLGIEPETAATTAHRCFLRFAEKFAPWKFEGDLAESARDVFLAGARAYAQVCDPQRRAALVADRKHPAATAAPSAASSAPRDVFRVETKLLDPEAQFRTGMKLVAGGRYGPAVEQLAFAADLDPQNLQYRSELAFCRFRADPEANAIKALEELCEVTRVDPLHGLGLFYTGEILRHAGRLDEAEVFLKRSIKPMTPDRRPIDALRELTRERKALQ